MPAVLERDTLFAMSGDVGEIRVRSDPANDLRQAAPAGFMVPTMSGLSLVPLPMWQRATWRWANMPTGPWVSTRRA